MEKRPTAADEVEAADQAMGAATLGMSGDQGAGIGAAAAELAQEGLGAVGRYRWVICGLLFFATTVNYVDRNVLAVLSPMLQVKIGWTNTQYGDINAAFTMAYAVGLLFAGGLIDRFGTRFGYPVFMALWGMASISHAFVSTVTGFRRARMALGLFESGNFPAAIKTTAEWFPRKERSLAIGLFNSGSNVGAILAPLLVPVITIHFGWQAAFCITGVLELIWICFWLAIYKKPEEHPRVSKAELNYIMSDPADPPAKIPWLRLFPYPQTWAFSVAKFLTDPVWWFWLFWVAPYLAKKFGMDIKHIGLPLIVIYCMASVGSIGGGWIASGLARMGWSTNMCRKLALLICAVLVLPVTVATKAPGEWSAVLLIGLAAAAHQGFSANLFALSGDLFPRKAVGSVVGIGGMLGAVGGMLFQWAAGRVVDHWSYVPLFIYAGTAYVLAIGLIQLLSPRLEQARLDGDGVAVA